MPFWAWHICVPHQAIFAIECLDCAVKRDILKELEIKKLERKAVKEFKRIEEEERIENERLEAERIETQRREAEEAAKSLISISRVAEVEEEFPLIVSLLRAPSKVNGRKQ